MTEIKVVLWNCSGILPSSAAEEKMKFFDAAIQSDFDVLVLVETHHIDIDDVTSLSLLRQNYRIEHTEADTGDPYGGIIILVSKNLVVSDVEELVKGRLLNFKITDSQHQYNISALYGYPGSRASPARLRTITEKLKMRHQISDQNIILGDFNFVDEDLDRTNKSRVGQNHIDKALTKVWIEFSHELDLSDPFRVKNPKKRMFSYIHTKDKAKSRLDRVYVNDENCNTIVQYKHIHTPFVKAHRILTFTLKPQGERGPGYWKMNTGIIVDRPYAIIVEKTVNDVLALNIIDPVERWLIFIQTITIETKAYCASKRYHEKAIRVICEKKVEALEQHPQLSSNNQLQEEYEHSLSMINEWHRKQMEGHQTRIKTQPKFEYGEPNIAFFADIEKKSAKKKTITHLMDEKGDIKHDTESLKNIASKFYTKLFSTKETNPQVGHKLLQNIKKKVSSQQRETLNQLISKEELFKAVMKLQKNKSPGPDGIPAEFYQTYWHLIQDLYFDFINKVKDSLFPQRRTCL